MSTDRDTLLDQLATARHGDVYARKDRARHGSELMRREVEWALPLLQAAHDRAQAAEATLEKLREMRDTVAHVVLVHEHGPADGWPECAACILAEFRQVLGDQG